MIHEPSLLESKSYLKKYNCISKAQTIKISDMNQQVSKGQLKAAQPDALAGATLGDRLGLFMVCHYSLVLF